MGELSRRGRSVARCGATRLGGVGDRSARPRSPRQHPLLRSRDGARSRRGAWEIRRGCARLPRHRRADDTHAPRDRPARSPCRTRERCIASAHARRAELPARAATDAVGRPRRPRRVPRGAGRGRLALVAWRPPRVRVKSRRRRAHVRDLSSRPRPRALAGPRAPRPRGRPQGSALALWQLRACRRSRCSARTSRLGQRSNLAREHGRAGALQRQPGAVPRRCRTADTPGQEHAELRDQPAERWTSPLRHRDDRDDHTEGERA